MIVITRLLPDSNYGRQLALNTALDKDASLPVGTDVLHPTTSARLVTETPNYNGKLLLVGAAKAALANHTVLKNIGVNVCRLFIKSFV